jgi:uncharacterized delta-60 repeat protein
LAIQEDGRLVAAGYSSKGNGATRFAVARYKTDGRLDPSFSDDGKKLTEFRGDDAGAYKVVIQENGKAVAAGYIYADKDRDFALARYEAE